MHLPNQKTATLHRRTNQSGRATLLGKDGNLIASTEKGSFTRSTSGNFKLEDSLQTKINSDGTITDTYAVEVFETSNARQGSFDRTPIYYIEYDATYYIMDGNIRITSVRGTATKSVSYASFQGSKAVVAHQGIAGSCKAMQKPSSLQIQKPW